MGLEISLPKDWEAEDDNGGDEGFECEGGVDLCKRPGKDERGVLGDDDLDVQGESINEEEHYYGESRIVDAEHGS